MNRIVWAREWLEEYGRVCKEGKVTLLLGKVWREQVTLIEEVGESVIYWIGKCWQRRI